MQLHMHLLKSIIVKAALATAALSGLLIFAGAPSAQAQDRDDYNHRRPVVRYDNFREQRAFDHRGYYSPRAEYWGHDRGQSHRGYNRDRGYSRDRD